MSYKTDMGRVIGLGSAKEGVHEWWIGRMTSVALIPLTLIFLCRVASLIGAEHAEVVTAFQSPLTAISTILFLLVAFRHLADGLKEVIVDYVHTKGMLIVLLVGTRLGCYALGFAGAFAVAKIAFSA
ncbi:MAG: succinate dehydrogenase, hydrophobic membrane anchor protein [Rhodobacteraceae bacterium]|nr:succinate dehydrogenase, hydrophobic membrane anchor protein [Paracoccaceae bacterium]